ncbi:MAG: FHA domain-containing protein [Chloroflexota bacterium]
MSLKLYKHQNINSHSGEIFALCRLARQLNTYYQPLSEEASLVVNLDYSSSSNLPQIDALLLTESFCSLIEIKNYFDPISARFLKGRWQVGTNKRHFVHSGNHKSPFLQVKNARKKWVSFLGKQSNGWSPRYDWNSLHSILLFYPALHPDSKLPTLGNESKWLTIQSFSELHDTLFAESRKQTGLRTARQEELIRYQLNCHPWADMQAALDETVGTLVVTNNGKAETLLPVKRMQEIVIGRSQKQNPTITIANPRVSRIHGRVLVNHRGVMYEDLGSTNGSFLDGKRLPNNNPIQLNPNKELHLGSETNLASTIRFEPVHTRGYYTNTTL